MTAYCFECKKQTDFSVVVKTEENTANGVHFSMKQKYAFCNQCRSEVLPDEIVDENVRIAHDAYREALGIITVAEMQQLLDMYNIGARPLSLLLEQGENTIERQMKHSIPDKNHSDRLKSLLDPSNMIKLLVDHSDRISGVAFNKALAAAVTGLEKIRSAEETWKAGSISFRTDEKQYVSASPVSLESGSEGAGARRPFFAFSSQPVVSKSNPFDYPDAA